MRAQAKNAAGIARPHPSKRPERTNRVAVASVSTGNAVPRVRRGKQGGADGSRVVQDADGSIRLRGKKSGGKTPNARVVMTCVPAPTKKDPHPAELVKTTNAHDRAHQVTDSQGRLIPAARTKRGHTRVLVPEATPREYPDYYMSDVHMEHGQKVGSSFEDQCDALHEMRLRLEGVAGLGYGDGDSSAELARAYIGRFESQHGLQETRNRIRRGTWQ